MPYLVDTNVLVRLAHRVDPQRAVATMHVYGVSHLLTFNAADFRRFPGITVRHPHDV